MSQYCKRNISRRFYSMSTPLITLTPLCWTEDSIKRKYLKYRGLIIMYFDHLNTIFKLTNEGSLNKNNSKMNNYFPR